MTFAVVSCSSAFSVLCLCNHRCSRLEMVCNLFEILQVSDFIFIFPSPSIVDNSCSPAGAHPSGQIGEHPKGRPENLLPLLAHMGVGRVDASTLQVFGNDYPTPYVPSDRCRTESLN
jgi:hypothetical protein